MLLLWLFSYFFYSNNVLEVQVDVHQTIQCPEVSTSSMESDEEVKTRRFHLFLRTSD